MTEGKTPPDITHMFGWQIIRLDDGRFGVYDDDSCKFGPFDTKIEALEVAQRSPRH